MKRTPPSRLWAGSQPLLADKQKGHWTLLKRTNCSIVAFFVRAPITLCAVILQCVYEIDHSGLFELHSDHKKLTSLLVRGGNSNDLNAEVPDLGEDLPRGIGGSNQLVQI